MTRLLSADAREALKGYAFWFSFMAAICMLIPLAAWKLFEIDLDPEIFGRAALGFMVAAMLGRFLAQPLKFLSNAWRIALVILAIFAVSVTFARAESFTPKPVPIVQGAHVTEAQIVQRAIPLIEHFEDVRLVAYLDPIGIPTICSGTTRGVEMGMKVSADYCRAMVRSEATEYWRGVSAFMTEDTLRERINVFRGAAFTSFTINVGIHAAGHSTAIKRLNAGNVAGACEAMTWWNKAGGKRLPGLVVRRTAESRDCMVGVAA